MIEVSLFVEVDEQAVQRAGDLAYWTDVMDRDHSAIVDTWDDVYYMIAVCHFSGGDYARYVRGSGWGSEQVTPDVPRADTENGPGLDDESDGITEHAPGVFSVTDDGR